MGPQLPLPLLSIVGQMSLPKNPRGDLHALHDLHIAGAAADVVAQGETNLLLCRIRILVQQSLGRHNHAGNAKAALDRSRFAKAVGISRFLKVAEALRCEDRLPFQLVGGHDAGPGGLSVHQDGTGAAGALAAAILYGGEAQLIPQKTQQLLILLRRNGSAVYHKCRHSTSPSIPIMGPRPPFIPLLL